MKEGWKSLRFEDVFTLQMGRTPDRKNPDYWEGNNTWVTISDLEKKYISDSKDKITDVAVEESGISLVKKGTAIMSFKLSVGKTAIAGKDIYTNEAIMSFVPRNEYVILPEFIYYSLRGYKWEGANKAVMGLTLNKKTISSHYFKFPPLSEQHQIVEELDLLSGIIEKKKEQLKELDNLAQSIFYEMFGDPVANEKGWEFCELSHLFNIKGGKRIPKGMSYSLTKTNHPYLRATDMKNNTIMDDDIHYIDSDVFEKIKNYTVSAGDIYLTNVGVNLGMAGVIPNKYDGANLTENAVKLVAKSGKEVVGLYISFYLNTNEIQACINERKMTVGVPKLAIFRIESIPLLLPPLSLQQSFASKIEAIEKQKALIKQSITETETLFNSRMDYYFG